MQRDKSFDVNRWTVDYLKDCLNKTSSVTFDIPGQWEEHECRKAAVLIPFLEKENEWHILFIRRSEHEHDHHSGQVAFAGGKHESQDSNLEATALREAQEEIGLNPQDVTILGELNQHHSISRFSITPVVAHIPWPYDFNLDKSEVARVFSIPLSWLIDPSNYRIEQRQLDNSKPIPVVYYNEFDGELLWGASARMMLSLINVLTRK